MHPPGRGSLLYSYLNASTGFRFEARRAGLRSVWVTDRFVLGDGIIALTRAEYADAEPDLRLVALALGSAPGQFKQPAGILGWGGRIYVADTANHRIELFEQTPPTLTPTPISRTARPCCHSRAKSCAAAA